MQLKVEYRNPYETVNITKPIERFDYQNQQIKWGNLGDYQIISAIGRGKYSHVFRGFDFNNHNHITIKILRPIRKSKIKREYHILKELTHKNIVNLIAAVRCSDSKTTSFIFEHIHHEDFRTLYPKLNLNDIKFYIKELLITLDYIHSQGIMHRDIKPHNILIDHHKRTLKLIDFGLAEYYFPAKVYSSRVASLYYKAPELILGEGCYSYSIDIWAVGMILAGLIFKKTPFVCSQNKSEQLLKLTKIVGTVELITYIKQKEKNHQFTEQKGFRQKFLPLLYDEETKKYPKSDFKEFIDKQNEEFATQQALDLIQGLLKLDKNERLTAKHALEHPFFLKKHHP